MANRPYSNATQIVDALVGALLEQLREAGIDLVALAHDPVSTLSATGEVAVVAIDPSDLPTHCSVAASYDPSSTPPRLFIAQDLSPGRRSFSALHEYAHHLRNHVDAVVDAFWSLPDGGASIEEDLADAFAAAVLLPTQTVAEIVSDGVTSSAVRRLWHASPASREACCVAAAKRLSIPGYVMLLDTNGTARFTARQGDLFAIRRDTPQTAATLTAALRGGHSQGMDAPQYASGVTGSLMHLDATADGEYVFAVWVTDSPPWGGLSVPTRSGPTGLDGYCDSCGQEFTSWKAPCTTCGDPRCPECGNCSCINGVSSSTTVQTRRCNRCFLELPLTAFDGASGTCNEH